MKIRRHLFLALASSGLFLTPACSTSSQVQRSFLEFGDTITFNLLSDLLTTNEEEKALKDARAQGLPLMNPARRADLDKIYKEVSHSTKATKYSDNRIKIHSDGALIGTNDRSELDFFIRAAAETLTEGYDGFVVVHLDYYKPGPRLLSLTPNLNMSSDRWIGTYESFLRHRNEKNMFETRSGVNRKVRQGVILMINDADFPNRDRFDATQIYQNLIEARYGL